MKRLAAVLLLVACLASAFADGAGDSSSSSSQKAQAGALPSGLKAAIENPISRFEIVTLGSYPIMLFYTDFIFDLTRYFQNGFNSNYAPWPFKSEYSATLTDTDRLVRLGVTLGASAVVGGIDALIHQLKLRAAERQRAAREDSPAQAGDAHAEAEQAEATPIPAATPSAASP